MKKKICYFTIWREECETVGINNKIKNQVKAFCNIGLDSYLCVSSNNFIKLYKYSKDNRDLKLIEERELSDKAKYSSQIGAVKRKISSCKRLKECINFLETSMGKYDFDILYIRRILPITISIAKYIKRTSKKGKKILWEIPTWNSYAKTLYWTMIKCQEKYMYRRLRKSITKIVAIASEEIKDDNILFINNGVDNESIAKRKLHNHDSINLICLATFAYWHGYDRLIEGLKNYYNDNSSNKREVKVKMVGNGDVEELKELSRKYRLDKYISFEGVLVGKELDDLFNEMDIAIGNLGFFREGVFSDTSIKIREYCARSIPFVTALNVNDFPKDYPYILKVPMDESPIDVNKIVEFYNSISDSNYLYEMRKYSEEYLSWENKLQGILKVIK